MQLLVPEKFIKSVNHFIYNNDMQTKLVYQKIEQKKIQPVRWAADDNDLVNKIEFKESAYKDWIETTLRERFNYYCTDDLDVFYGSQKAITSNGLIRNINRHEKDDRPGKWHKGKYRLGWDNRETVKYLQEEKSKQEANYQKISSKIKEITPRIEAISQNIQAVTNILRYQNYDEIDWQRHAEKIVDLNKQIDNLKKSSNAYELIIKQINAIDASLNSEKLSRDTLLRKLTNLETSYNQKNTKLLSLGFEDLTEAGTLVIETFLKDEDIYISNDSEPISFENGKNILKTD